MLFSQTVFLLFTHASFIVSISSKFHLIYYRNHKDNLQRTPFEVTAIIPRPCWITAPNLPPLLLAIIEQITEKYYGIYSSTELLYKVVIQHIVIKWLFLKNQDQPITDRGQMGLPADHWHRKHSVVHWSPNTTDLGKQVSQRNPAHLVQRPGEHGQVCRAWMNRRNEKYDRNPDSTRCSPTAITSPLCESHSCKILQNCLHQKLSKWGEKQEFPQSSGVLLSP